MTQLYKLSDEYHLALNNLQQLFDAGDIDQAALTDTLEGLEGAVKDKAINVGLHILNLRSDLAQLEAVKSTFDARIKSAKASVEFYEGYLDTNLQKAGITEIKNDLVMIKYKRIPAIVDITGEVPAPFQRVIPEKREPDKRAIGDALKSGQVLPWAVLIDGRTKLEIR
jgi:hypothetical protein